MQSLTKTLKIYSPFALNEMKRLFAYKGKFYLNILGNLFSVFIAYYLWVAIYNNSSSDVLGGLSKYEMITYVFMSYITTNIISTTIAKEIGQNVVDGSIAINLIKPIDYRGSLISKAIGIMIYKFFVPSVFIWIGIEIYRVSVLGLPVTGVYNILLFLISCLMSFLIYVLFDFCFGMVAFYTTYVFGLMIIKQAVLTFLSGQLIPLSFFPDIVQEIFDFLPFSSMNYTPVMIYLGKYNNSEIILVLLRQAMWIVILYLLGSFIWSKVTKRLIVLGG